MEKYAIILHPIHKANIRMLVEHCLKMRRIGNRIVNCGVVLVNIDSINIDFCFIAEERYN